MPETMINPLPVSISGKARAGMTVPFRPSRRGEDTKRMARTTEDIGYPRVRKYRIRDSRRQAVGDAGLDRRGGAEPVTDWACVNLGYGRRTQYQVVEPKRETIRRSRLRKEPVHKEPVWDSYHEEEDDYYYPDLDDDFGESLPERDGLMIRAARGVVAAWDRVWSYRSTGGLSRSVVVAAAVFAAGVLVENQVHFLGRIADLLAGAALTLRDWVNPGAQTALLLTGLITVTGIWLLKRAINHPGSGTPARRRAAIPREMLDRHL